MLCTTSTTTHELPDTLIITPLPKIRRGSPTPPTTMLHRRQNPTRPEPSTTGTAAQDSSQKLPHPIADDHTPLPKALEPLHHRINFFLRLWTLKILGTLFLWYQTTFLPQPPETNPDLIKRYPCRPKLPVHIFFPPSHLLKNRPNSPPETTDLNSRTAEKPPQSQPHVQTLLPLYIDIHGGGLALGTATLDNTFSRSWSRRTGMLVASLNYSKTPSHPFPAPSHDVAELASAVIDDPDLPIDRSRVVIGGFSAGGLLSLSATQLVPLKGRVRAAVAYYPAVDFSEYPSVKFERRLDKTRAFEGLNVMGGALDWGYVSAGQNRRDSILSPCYATAEDLPEYVCVVGAQYDLFCREAMGMVFKLAGRKVSEEGWKTEFEEGRYKWIYAKGMRHGFTEEIGRKVGPWDVKRRDFCERTYDDIHQWLAKYVL